MTKEYVSPRNATGPGAVEATMNVGAGNGSPPPAADYFECPRPATPDWQTPRADGGMATGETGGNHEGHEVPSLQVAPGEEEE